MDHYQKTLQAMEKLAQSYVPEWKFSAEEPDAGSALAMLLAGMTAETADRFDLALYRHKLQYLNLFDRFKEEPIEAAGSYVRFETVPALEEPVHVPAGTQMFALSDAADTPVMFETTHGLTVSGAKLRAVVGTSRAEGQIVRLLDAAEDEDTAAEASFTAFYTGEGDNLETHRLLLGFSDLPVQPGPLELFLELETPRPEDLPAALELLASADIRLSLYTAEGFVPFTEVSREGAALRLASNSITPALMELQGRECYVIAAEAQGVQPLQLTGAGLRFSAAGLEPEVVSTQGVVQSPAHFRPFGVPLQVFAQCELDSRAVFDRAGATVTIDFDLDYEEFEQRPAEMVVDQEYKIVMRKPRSVPRQETVEVRCDEVAAEYLSSTGWKPLPLGTEVEKLFSGERRGPVSLRFVMPGDILPAELAGSQARLRLRLVRADGLYQVPSVQLCPVIGNLRLAYAFDTAPLRPCAAETENNFAVLNVQPLLAQARPVTAFYTGELEWPAMYLGFDENPWGTPASLYLTLENNADLPVDFAMEYLSEAGFVRIKVGDGTGGLCYSGALLMVVPQDIRRRSLYGRELYWLRMVCYSRNVPAYNLPHVGGIFTNMARVVNAVSRTEDFYLDDFDSAHTVSLAERNLITARVYVNEAELPGEAQAAQGAPATENWVLWQKGEAHHPGRVYGIDLAAGLVTIAKNRLSSYPPRADGPTLRVVYQSYHGSAANLPAGTITTLNQSIRGISAISNPIPALGGYDGYNEETSRTIIGNMLRTRGRAVTLQDYVDIISQVSYGVRQIKCVPGIDIAGEDAPGAVTIAILMDEYIKGGHIFAAVKEAVTKALTERSALLPLGKQLYLTQPKFVRMNVRLWLESEKMENAYDLQRLCAESVERFIDPLAGGFEGKGWKIGVLPTVPQLLSYLKMQHPGMAVAKVVMTAEFESREYAVDSHLTQHITSPFAMAVNGTHVVHVGLAPPPGGPPLPG